MNHEARAILIRRLIGEVRAETLALTAKGGADPNTNAHDQLWEKIDRWRQAMERMEKTMRSDLHFAYVRNARGGRAASWQQRQRIASVESRNAGLRALLGELALAIAELIDAMTPGSVAWKRLIKSLEKVMKEGGDDTALDPAAHRELIEVIREADPEGPAQGAPGGVFPAMNLVTLVLALFVILRRR